MSNDAFPNSSVSALRAFAAHHFPKHGAYKMNREALVQLIAQAMIEAEISAYVRSTRRLSADVCDFPALSKTICRRLEDCFDKKILTQYFSSSIRANHAGLQDLLHNLRGSTSPTTTSSRSQVDIASELDQMEQTPRVQGSSEDVNLAMSSLKEAEAGAGLDWPRPICNVLVQERMQEFRRKTQLQVQDTCCVCARRSFSQDLLFVKKPVKCERIDARLLDLSSLQITDAHIRAHHMDAFQFGHELIDGLALDPAGIHIDDWRVELDVCRECKTSLTKAEVPRLSLANGNIRGQLPAHLQDCTWLEERLCAIYLPSACVVRLYDLTAPGAPEHRARVMRGHACSFPLNTISTAVKLPRAFGDGSVFVSCLVIGPRLPRLEDLRKVFKVRRKVVEDLLLYLRQNFKDYPQFPINEDALNELPEDDVPELLMRHTVFEEKGDVPSLFEAETTGLEHHPGLSADSDDNDAGGRTFLEHHGMLDVNGVNIPAHGRVAAALSHAVGNVNTDSTDGVGGLRPDLIIRHGTTFVQEYNNPKLFPGMYPTLFPWGTGGFESDRAVHLSFGRQASHLLDLADPSFRRHWSYIFVVANMKQRRLIHLGTRLVCKARDFERLSRSIRGVDLDTIKSVHQHLQSGGNPQTVSQDELKVLKLLKECQLISARVPGSKAVMTRARADIRGYIGELGIFHLFLTLNPSPVHSPVFQVFYGDGTVNLDVQVPTMPSADIRAIRVADDPVSASDYFHFHVAAVFKYLFGWDAERKASTADGGIIGPLKAFFMVKEHTMRGQLHGHALLWLEGGLNPKHLRQKLKTDDDFQQRYLAYFDELIHHHLPEGPQGGQQPKSKRFPRQERPPDPSQPGYSQAFAEDHRLLGEELQRHTCKTTCFKGGRTSCRFLFPHELNERAFFDAETNSVHPRVSDATVNYHNPALLVATRHNHDLKSVQSGKSGVAAASYITSYTTKSEETPANQVSMIQTVFERMARLGQDSTILKDLLSRCVMQFGRERQIHAQQAATYVRDLGDTWVSHETVPMLSGRLMLTVISMFGPVRTGSGSSACISSPEEPSLSTQPSAERASESQAPHDVDQPQPDEGRADDCLDDEDHDTEQFLPLASKGRTHQVDDYLHRGPTLQNLNFYEFVQHCRLVPKPKKPNKNHHPLSESHPDKATSCHRYFADRPIGIPRAIFSRFPRSDGSSTHGDEYCAAMLAHFRPFSATLPLKARSITYEQQFQETSFSPKSLRVMDNWAALTECDDARDAEQLLRRKREACRNSLHDEVGADIIIRSEDAIDDSRADVNIEALLKRPRGHTVETLNLMATLATSNWFLSAKHSPSTGPGPSGLSTVAAQCPAFTLARRKKWLNQLAQLDAQAKATASTPRASTGILATALTFGDATAAPETTEDETITHRPIRAHQTIRCHWTDPPPQEIIDTLVTERGLTRSQALAFKIAARHFFEDLMDQSGEPRTPLRLFMHGEAGTGKTVVVRLLRELLERYGKGGEIMFMAPTGKAACAIGGSTQHSSFALRITRRGLTSDDLSNPTGDINQANRIRYLQSTFQNVRWLFFDEVSMTSCEVMAEIDQALRIGRQAPNTPFGGMNVLFAGDLCQLPPVGAAALYTKSSLSSKTAEVRTMMELGRAAWREVNNVVNFTEQMRMKSKDMAAALRRLRLRQCTAEDAALFNLKVLKSAKNPQGVIVNGEAEAIVLARTNETVRALNHHKATETAKLSRQDLVVCSAQDKTTAQMTAQRRIALLSYNGSGSTKVGLGRIPLYKGMPVVYRGANQSVALGITNGAFATVEDWDVGVDKWGHTVARGVVLRFANEAEIHCADLPSNTVPILPANSNFKFTSPTDDGVGPATVENVGRRQLPIQPGFAMTVHSAQGITARGPVIVDLRRGGFEAYVSASRATCKEHLFLVAPVTVSELNHPPLPLGLRHELQRLAKLADTTTSRHDHDHWTVAAAQPAAASTSNSRVRDRDPSDDDVQPPATRRRLC